VTRTELWGAALATPLPTLRLAREPRPVKRSLRALEWLNFLMADVQNGLGPYLAVFLKGAGHWNAGDIGIAMAVSNMAGAAGQMPAGMLVDALRSKRLLVAAAALVTVPGCLTIALRPELAWVVGAQSAIGITAALLPPASSATGVCRSSSPGTKLSAMPGLSRPQS
jgi:MFS family permease